MSPLLRRSETRRKADSADPEDLMTLLDSHNPSSEDYRSLRTSLMYAIAASQPRAIVVTSPGQGEGKSTTCANLGVVLAQAGKKTLLLDCDLRRPALHMLCSLRNMSGLVNVLVDEHTLEEVVQESVENLHVATSGPLPPNPAELLSSPRFSQLLRQAREEYDYVLLDTPPTGAVSDALAVSTQSDGVLLVINTRNTRKGAVRQSVRGLESVGAKVLGTVMNNIKAGKKGYYSYGGYYSS